MTVNPVEEMTHSTGWCNTIDVNIMSPLKIIMGIPKLIILKNLRFIFFYTLVYILFG